ncbi:hypothetical protein F5Y18DRAFT_419522 [Xylariaceae sp. FL1019]|nr:hypothetical protein F5Y18DRAFT_419522 [Xylariaceae sp. FL1019]
MPSRIEPSDDGLSNHAPFVRPVFSPRSADFAGHGNAKQSDISSLPQLIQYNSKSNPHRVFALQASLGDYRGRLDSDVAYNVSPITFRQLALMVRRCCSWIRKIVDLDANRDKQDPIAIYAESDVGLFVHLAALLTMDKPALLISARLNSPSVLHLLEKTGAKTILASKRTRPSLSREVYNTAKVASIEHYSTFMEDDSVETHEPEPILMEKEQTRNADEKGAVILHSSGTTGLPKPIYLAHRYILGYAACHSFPSEQEVNWVNLSTLPLYHGFGLLAPCLSLSVGMTCCFPPSSIVPATKSTLDLIKYASCQSLMTVPSIIDDILGLQDDRERTEALGLLAELKFLAVGGGALKAENGTTLAKHHIRLLNHYGVTEIGAIAPIFCPGPDYNWRFLRLRQDLGLELHPISQSKHFRLTGYPIGWDKPFEVQDELERNEASSHMEVRILGRTDDVIVLKTGEKVQPRQIEDALNADPQVRNAVCVGSGFFELLVIVEPANEQMGAEEVKNHVWNLLSTINATVDHHARITSKKAIIVKPADKSIPRSDKGSVMRQAVHEMFKDEIREAYSAIEMDAVGDDTVFDSSDLGSSVRKIITTVAGNRLDGNSMGADDDFFEAGMDSLQTVQFARLINAGVRKMGDDSEGAQPTISAEFIYRNPSIERLTAAIAKLRHGTSRDGYSRPEDRATEMLTLANEYITSIASDTTVPRSKHTVLMTGSTGNLGAHALAELSRNGNVAKIICLVRGQRQVTGSAVNGEATVPLMDRQRDALGTAGISLAPQEWAKIELHDLRSLAGRGDTCQTLLSEVTGQVTHILHLAWPMDFHRRLESFRPQIELLQTLAKIAQEAFVERRRAEPIRLLFSSSIAAVRYFAESGKGGRVPESVIQDPLVPVPMGYAEAKWVCESYLDSLAKSCSGVDPVVVRIGQLSGPEKTSGTWKADEHIPRLVKSSQKIGAFPDIKGQWLERATAAGGTGSLDSFYKQHFSQLASGLVVLDTTNARAVSPSLARSGGLEKDLVMKYVDRWRRAGFLE